jgi:gamma-glutamylcyclotransferase (GGCT)/AIG2-like uncharacterized protein YtfP
MHRVFVYGTLKRSQGNYRHFLSDQIFVGSAITVPRYSMIAGGYPVLLDVDGNRSDVVGEVFDVDDMALQRLDGLEGYRGEGQMSNMYDRKVIAVKVWTGSELLETEANIYIGAGRFSFHDRSMNFWNIKNSSGQLEWPRATT